MSRLIFNKLGVSTDYPCVEECVLATGKSEDECKAMCNGKDCDT